MAALGTHSPGIRTPQNTEARLLGRAIDPQGSTRLARSLGYAAGLSLSQLILASTVNYDLCQLHCFLLASLSQDRYFVAHPSI